MAIFKCKSKRDKKGYFVQASRCSVTADKFCDGSEKCPPLVIKVC